MKVVRIAGIALAFGVAIIAVGTAMAWAPDRPAAALVARWAPPPSQLVSIDGMQVHLRDEGVRDDPVPLLLLHGTSASLHTWDGWVAALKDKHRLIRVDLPGFGLTGPRPDGGYAMADYTRFIATLLDQLGVAKVAMVGNSFGGYVAWKMAVDHPERVAKLVLIDASGYAYHSQSTPIGFKLAQVPALAPLIVRLLPRSVIESSVRSVYADPSRITPQLIDRYYELTLREGNRGAVIERFRQARGGELEAEVKRIKQPTLIVWGAEDRLIPVESARRFQQDITGSHLVILKGLAHVPHEEDPARTVAAVKPFLDDAAL